MSIKGKTFVFTGKISKPRHEFEALVEANGGLFGSAITSSTDYLVVGEKPGSKLVLAQMKNIPTLTEEAFLALLQEADEPEEQNEPGTIRKCKWCSREYWRRDIEKDYGTCTYCEMVSKPNCPHCDEDAIFIEDLLMYHCMTCGQWFQSPFSVKARKVNHHHMWIKRNGLTFECICGHKATISMDDTEHEHLNYLAAPQKVIERRKFYTELDKKRESERKAQEWFDSLTEEQKQALVKETNDRVSEKV
jgi:hypothetical protein